MFEDDSISITVWLDNFRSKTVIHLEKTAFLNLDLEDIILDVIKTNYQKIKERKKEMIGYFLVGGMTGVVISLVFICIFLENRWR